MVAQLHQISKTDVIDNTLPSSVGKMATEKNHPEWQEMNTYDQISKTDNRKYGHPTRSDSQELQLLTTTVGKMTTEKIPQEWYL